MNKLHFPWVKKLLTFGTHTSSHFTIENTDGDVIAEVRTGMPISKYSWEYYPQTYVSGSCNDLPTAMENVERRLERDGFKQVDEKLRPLR